LDRSAKPKGVGMMKMATIVLVTIVLLIIVDLFGVVLSFVLTFLELEDDMSEAFYLIWFMLGLNCGVLIYLGAGASIGSGTGFDWTGSDDAIRTGRLVLSTMLVVLAALLVAGYRYLWPTAPSAYVPGSESLTITFFAGTALSAAFLHRATKTEAKRVQRQPAGRCS
jgi:cation transport ATPase